MVKTLFKNKYFTLGLLALLGILAYSNTFSVPFVFDDDAYVVNNPVVKSFHFFAHPGDIAQLDNLSPTAFNATLRYAFMTRILSYLSLALNYRIGGLNVTGFHIVNLLLHLANGFLLFFILRSLLGTDKEEEHPEAGWLTAITVAIPFLFVLHPIPTHAVTYITSRFVLLASFFFLAAILLYCRSVLAAAPRRKYLLYSCAVLCAVAAMLSKEFTFILPFVICLCDMTFFSGTLRDRVRRILPISLTIFVIPTLVFLQQKSFSSLDSTMRTITAANFSEISRGDYLLTQFRVVVSYLRLLFFPVGQNLDHDFPVYHSLAAPPVFLSLLLLLALAATAVYLFIRSTFNVQRLALENQGANSSRLAPRALCLIPFGILWFFITLSVESSILPLGELAAEYRLYLPSIGIFIAFAALVRLCVARLADSPRTRCALLTGFFATVIAVLGAATFTRNAVWKDEISLWEDAARKSPAKLRPHQNLGTYYSMRGRLDDARRELLAALAIDPENFEIHNNLGIVYRKMGDNPGAIREYSAAIRLMPNDAMARFNLGNVYLDQGDNAAAIREYSECLRMIPDYDELHDNLAIAYQRSGRYGEAYREFQEALRLNPQNANVRSNLQSLLRRMGEAKPLGHR